MSLSLSKTLYPLLRTGSTQEDRKLSRHDWGIVDWDIISINNYKQNLSVHTVKPVTATQKEDQKLFFRPIIA